MQFKKVNDPTWECMSHLHFKRYDLKEMFNDTSRYVDDTFTIDNL